MRSLLATHPRPARWILIAAGALALLVAVRVAVEPRGASSPPQELSAGEQALAAEALHRSSVARDELLRELATRRILLAGESHFYEEPQIFAEELIADLHARDGRAAVLLLELPGGMQGDLDRYVATGDEAALQRAWSSQTALPYQKLVAWARVHPELVRRVAAYDESSAHIALMRLLATDTRNATMAEAIANAARENAGDRVVAFGGRLHMMKAGRYLYDSPTRSPIGARLQRLGFAAGDIAALWIFTGAPSAEGAWAEPGAVSFAGAAGELPIRALQPEAVFGASRLSEVADFAVFLGPETRIAGR